MGRFDAPAARRPISGRVVLSLGAVVGVVTFLTGTRLPLLPGPVLVVLGVAVLLAAAWTLMRGDAHQRRGALLAAILVVLPWAYSGYFLAFGPD